MQDTPPPVSLKSFIGRWEEGPEGNDIQIKAGQVSGMLAVDGSGYWPSRSDPRSNGTLRGEAMPVNGTLRVVANGCNVRIDILTPYLIVNDLSTACSGHNVTFTGLYMRAKK